MSNRNNYIDPITKRQRKLLDEIGRGSRGFFYGDIHTEPEFRRMERENRNTSSEGFELVEVGDLKVDLDKVKFNSKDKISNGAFGTVYKLTDGKNRDERFVAKKMASFFLSDKFMPHLPKMFHREVVAFEYLSKLGITPRIIYANYEKRYFVMERLDKTLSELVEKCEFSPHHVEKLTELLSKIIFTPYRHDDFHNNNIMWSESADCFYFIDWGYYRLLTHTSPLSDYQFLRQKFPDMDPETKVYHKKNSPRDLRLMGDNFEYVDLVIKYHRSKGRDEWTPASLMWNEFLILVNYISSYQDYLYSRLEIYEKKCQKRGPEGMGYKHLLDKKRSKKSKKKRVSSDKKKTGVGGWGHKLRVEGGVAGMGYKHLLDKKRSKKSKKKRVSSDKKKTGVGGWGHKLRVEAGVAGMGYKHLLDKKRSKKSKKKRVSSNKKK